ncbi:MAG: hypothetical protein KAG61_12540 [Bacteriovoracaceae bacterium]|nr:hypothetical protein [Bacteriovoracaceae bacterium]
MQIYLAWMQDHLLAVVAIIMMAVLVYHYLIERDTGVKLSKRYRNSIFEAQSKIFLNATQYLISGNKDLAIREFLNAVDLNRETIDTYFALGGLFRSNGEIEKAISIHRSLIARDNISESTRLRSLKELALDFDKGGFVDKAIETYKDCLSINRDQADVIQSLCRIFEDVGEWDDALEFRLILDKVSLENQAETISHILVEKSKGLFERGEFARCQDELEEAFRYAPSVSAKILWLKLSLTNGNMDRAKSLLLELLYEHPMYATFVFESLEGGFRGEEKLVQNYNTRLELLKNFFLDISDAELLQSPSVILTKVRLLKRSGKVLDAYELLKSWTERDIRSNEALKVEYIKLLIDLEKKDELLIHTKDLVGNLDSTLTKHFCKLCGYNSDEIFWRCPQCHEWETIQFRLKV